MEKLTTQRNYQELGSPDEAGYFHEFPSQKPMQALPLQKENALELDFDHENRMRNAFLAEKGMAMPKTTKTGTTIVGCLFKGNSTRG